jgi:hypothetical protein
MKINKQKGGLVKWFLVIIAIIALASFFFDFSVQEVVEDEQTQENFGYIWTNVSYFYDTYLESSVSYLWNDIFIDLIWNNFTRDLGSMKAGEATSFETLAPRVEVS